MAVNDKNINGESSNNKWYTRFVDNVSFFNTIDTLMDNLKSWVEGMITGTLIIHDGNWFNYIKPRPELKTLPSNNNITGPNYGYWIGIYSISENGNAFTDSYGTGIWNTVRSTEWEDFIEWIKEENNQKEHLISIRCCELVLPSWVRTVQFACSRVNFEYLTIYPPKYSRSVNEYTNHKNCNGYRISIFQLPTDGVYISSPNIDSDHPNARRVLLMEKQNWDHTDRLSTEGGIYNATTAKESIKLYPDKIKDDSLLVVANSSNIQSSNSDSGTSLGTGTTIGELSTTSTSYLKTVKSFVDNITDVENYSAFTHLSEVSNIQYYSSVLPSHGGFILKPGAVGDMIWFNNYWYLCGTR